MSILQVDAACICCYNLSLRSIYGNQQWCVSGNTTCKWQCLAPTEDKIDNMKDRLYEEIEHVFDKFSKYPMKILLGDFNAKAGRE